jgi:hypothetical protein
MKLVRFLLLFSAFNAITGLAYSQQLIFPPELHWWVDEVQKANPTITLSAFKHVASTSEKLSKEPGRLLAPYPIFRRWNYSGNQCGYFNAGLGLAKQNDGRYRISADVDSALLILDRNNDVRFRDSYGSCSGVDSIAWTRDNVLIAVGTQTVQRNNDEYVVDLFIKEYTIDSERVKISTFEYPSAFNSDVRSSLRLNWIEQREDYFEGN